MAFWNAQVTASEFWGLRSANNSATRSGGRPAKARRREAPKSSSCSVRGGRAGRLAFDSRLVAKWSFEFLEAAVLCRGELGRDLEVGEIEEHVSDAFELLLEPPALGSTTCAPRSRGQTSTTVHMKDVDSGPEGYFPFIQSVLEGFAGGEAIHD